ncbi:MAG: helix-turn-helix domain-containing protein [Proteiniphilum sp.]|jgi:IS30 family transposase|nr:helix-turn-helix domain-containing protein [Proteiniphilum sp.]
MKNKKHLTREQRYEIEILLRIGKSQKEIAELLGKDKSVISRELKRNSHKRGYSARMAQEYADYYFAHPYSSWERGLNKYTNGLIL